MQHNIHCTVHSTRGFHLHWGQSYWHLCSINRAQPEEQHTSSSLLLKPILPGLVRTGQYMSITLHDGKHTQCICPLPPVNNEHPDTTPVSSCPPLWPALAQSGTEHSLKEKTNAPPNIVCGHLHTVHTYLQKLHRSKSKTLFSSAILGGLNASHTNAHTHTS